MVQEKATKFGQNLVKIRELVSQERGFPFRQEDLARILKRGRSQIGNWENSERKPKEDKIEEIAHIFGVPVDTLMHEQVTELGAGWEARISAPKPKILEV